MTIKRKLLDHFKCLLTAAGARLPQSALIQIQALVNYLAIGRWMRERGFVFSNRAGRREEVWDAMISRLSNRNVLYLEFGVANGVSIRYWSNNLKNPNATLHGFDSFEGLPEKGGPWRKGQFDTDGRVPKIDDARVRFFKGWFDQVLPTYAIPPHDVLVLNLDADLYSSTIFVLEFLRPYIKPGTLLYFDEMNHVDHEPRAFDEFVAKSKLNFKPVHADRTLAHVSFECV